MQLSCGASTDPEKCESLATFLGDFRLSNVRQAGRFKGGCGILGHSTKFRGLTSCEVNAQPDCGLGRFGP